MQEKVEKLIEKYPKYKHNFITTQNHIKSMPEEVREEFLNIFAKQKKAFKFFKGENDDTDNTIE